MKNWLVLLCVLFALPCAAQPDFLTADEVDQVREAQEPNERLLLYLKFASERVALVGQLTAKDKPGRSAMIHDALQEYTDIIDAIDAVTDDALLRKASVDKGLAAVAEAEKQMLAALEKVAESQPKDMILYKFSLEQAIDTTRDNIELSLEDLKTRAAELEAKAEKERKEREALARPVEVETKPAAPEKEAGEKKAPTLRRKGETVRENP